MIDLLAVTDERRRKWLDRDLWMIMGLEALEWQTPLQLGGSSRSHHSATLRRLVRTGLAVTRQRSGYSENPKNRARGSREYALSERGVRLRALIKSQDRHWLEIARMGDVETFQSLINQSDQSQGEI